MSIPMALRCPYKTIKVMTPGGYPLRVSIERTSTTVKVYRYGKLVGEVASGKGLHDRIYRLVFKKDAA